MRFDPHARRTGTAAAVVALCLVLGVAIAAAEIVPQVGIGGAKLGMTLEKVLDKLGKPDRERTLTSPIGGFDYVELKYGKTKISFDGVEKSSKVLGVTTRDRDERTESGVGVGSTKDEVKEGVKGVTCANEFGVHHCYVGDFLPGEIVTDFKLKKKDDGEPALVKRVTVGTVLD